MSHPNPIPNDPNPTGVWPPPPSTPPMPTPIVEAEPPKKLWWKRLFWIPSGPATVREVWNWWQARRLSYNLMVYGFGAISFCFYLFFLLSSGLLPPGEDAVEPMELITAPVLVPIAVNICYTFGVIAELLWRLISGDQTRRSGRFIMRVGVGFSFFVILFPSVAWGIMWFRHVILHL